MKKNSEQYFFGELRELLKEKFSFQYDLLELETDLERDLAFDSRDFFEFLDNLEEKFQIELDSDKVDYLLRNYQLNTLQDIVSLIKATIAK